MQSLGGHPRNKSFSQGTEHLVINLNGINPLTCERLQLKRQNLSETMIFFWTSFKALLMSLVRGTDHEKLACSFAAMSYEHLDNFVKWSDEVVGYRRHKAFQICPIKTHILYTSLSVFASTTSSVISYNAQETFPRCGLLILLPSYNTMVNVCNNERGYWCWMTSILYMNRIHVSEHPPYQRQCEFPCLFFFYYKLETCIEEVLPKTERLRWRPLWMWLRHYRLARIIASCEATDGSKLKCSRTVVRRKEPN